MDGRGRRLAVTGRVARSTGLAQSLPATSRGSIHSGHPPARLVADPVQGAVVGAELLLGIIHSAASRANVSEIAR